MFSLAEGTKDLIGQPMQECLNGRIGELAVCISDAGKSCPTLAVHPQGLRQEQHPRRSPRR
jgi:hypothetical protein